MCSCRLIRTRFFTFVSDAALVATLTNAATRVSQRVGLSASTPSAAVLLALLLTDSRFTMAVISPPENSHFRQGESAEWLNSLIENFFWSRMLLPMWERDLRAEVDAQLSVRSQPISPSLGNGAASALAAAAVAAVCSQYSFLKHS